jgi:hypothetical protein
VRLATLPGPAAVVAVSIDRPELVAGDEGARVVARTLDAAGNPVPATLALDVHGGVLDAVEEQRPGVVSARLSAGTTLQGDEAVVTASASTLGIAGSRAVPLRPAEPASARFARRGLVWGDGRRETLLRVAVADRYGNPVSVLPAVTAERGRIVQVSQAGPGTFDVRYVPPAVERPATDALVARAGDARGTLDPLIAPPPPALRLADAGGPVVDLAGRFAAASFVFAAERPVGLESALRAGVAPALRLEAGGLHGGSGGARVLLLAGPSARRAEGRAVLGLSATGGALLGRAEAGLAGRLALSLGLARPGLEPFLEASVLAASRGGPGSFVAAGLAVGLRFGVEAHAHDPDRR